MPPLSGLLKSPSAYSKKKIISNTNDEDAVRARASSLSGGERELGAAETRLHWCEVPVRRWCSHYQKTLLAGAPFLVKSGTRDRTPISMGTDSLGIGF